MDSIPQLTVVTGLPRCGTSLLMKVLHQSGMVPFVDEFYSYESKLTNTLNEDNRWVVELPKEGFQVIKALYPQVLDLPYTDPRYNVEVNLQYNMLWMVRNAREMAKSQRLFMIQMGNKVHRGWLGPRTKLIRKANKSMVDFFRRAANVNFEVISFDGLLTNPQPEVEKIARLTGVVPNLSCVVHRSPKNSGQLIGTLEIPANPNSLPLIT